MTMVHVCCIRVIALLESASDPFSMGVVTICLVFTILFFISAASPIRDVVAMLDCY